jgi:hypothetical protein
MDDNTNLLVAAKDEYTKQLYDILTPNLYTGIKTIWDTTRTLYDGKNTSILKEFQKKLETVKSWNQEIINNEYNRIIKSSPILSGNHETLDKIIEAVIISHVKILSVIKRNNSTDPIPIKILNTKNFIHLCYIQCAREFYKEPRIIDDRYDDDIVNKHYKLSLKTIKLAIEQTIRENIPFQDILNSYFNDLLNEQNSVNSINCQTPMLNTNNNSSRSDSDSDRNSEDSRQEDNGNDNENENDNDYDNNDNEDFYSDKNFSVRSNSPENSDRENNIGNYSDTENNILFNKPDFTMTDGNNIEDSIINNYKTPLQNVDTNVDTNVSTNVSTKQIPIGKILNKERESLVVDSYATSSKDEDPFFSESDEE